MARYVCYMCKHLMTSREDLMAIMVKSEFRCRNPNCQIGRETVIGKLPPYLYRLRKAR